MAGGEVAVEVQAALAHGHGRGGERQELELGPGVGVGLGRLVGVQAHGAEDAAHLAGEVRGLAGGLQVYADGDHLAHPAFQGAGKGFGRVVQQVQVRMGVNEFHCAVS